MLVLTRKVNEEILIGDRIRIKVIDIGAGRIRLGISAPREMTVLRDDVARHGDESGVEVETEFEFESGTDSDSDCAVHTTGTRRHKRDIWINPDLKPR